MAFNNENNPMVASVHMGTLSANTDMGALSLSRKHKIKSVKLVNGAALAASNTNYVTLQLKKGATVIAEIDTRAANEGALVALEGKLAPLEADQEIQEGDLSLSLVVAGTGALTQAKVMLELHTL